MDIKLEDFSSSDYDLTIAKGIFLQDKNTTSGTGFERYNRIGIPNASEVKNQNKQKCFSKNLETKVKDDETSSDYDFKMDNKISIKEEPLVSDAELSTEEYLEFTSVGMEIKNETNTENDFKDDIKLESGMQENVSQISSQSNKCFSLDLVKKIKKEPANCIIRDVETTAEPESESHSETHPLPDTSQATENKEGVLSENVMAEDTPSLGSPRLYAETSNFNSVRNGFTEIFPNEGNNYSLSSNSLHYDLATIKKEKCYKCNICDLSYTRLWYLKLHKTNHEGQKPHKCDVCDKSFIQLGHLKDHMLIHEGKKLHKCDICLKSFTKLVNLKTHKLIHDGKKPHKCDICDKSCTLLQNFKRHKLIHEEKRPYKCDVCDMSFTELGSLKRHKLIHEGKRPHKCDYCDKSFIQVGNFKIHKLIHAGEKPHTCDVCDKRFTRLGHLKRHKLTHENEKPHKCDVCDKNFTQLGNLKIHKLIHKGIKPHKCDVCNESFTRLEALRRHKLIHEHNKH